MACLPPVWLDTTMDEGVRAYEEVGFNIVGQCMVVTNADERGIGLRKGSEQDKREEGRRIAKKRVMVRMPE